MSRAAKPYLYRGWYVTDAGGSRRKLCPESDGFERAVALLGRAPMLADVVPLYLKYCREYYHLPNGKPSKEPSKMGQAFSRFTADPIPLNCDRSHVVKFRESLISEGLSRNYINQTIARIVRGLHWLAENGHIPDASASSAKLITPLQAFRSGVVETDDVEPVEWNVVEKTLAHLEPFWQSLIMLQWHTGMRPGEVCSLAVVEVDTSREMWVVDKGRNHKTAYRGRTRVIPIGPSARSVLERWLQLAKTKKQPYIFRARNSGSDGHVQESSYCHAIARACKKADIETWSPNQLRHAYATRLRAAAGLDAAQLMLGHSSADVTQIYAEVDLKRAAELAAKLG